MSERETIELETVGEQSDDELKAVLPELLQAVEGDLDDLLLNRPEEFRGLVGRVSALDDMAEFAEQESEAVDAYFRILWGGLERISQEVDAVSEEVTQEFSVTWSATDSDVAFHMETDPDAGTISGGPGEHGDAELTFLGETDVLTSMLGDSDFDPTQAFMQGRFQIDGPIPKAQQMGLFMRNALSKLDD